MLIPSPVLSALLTHGVSVHPAGSDVVTLVDPLTGEALTAAVRAVNSLSPSALTRLVDRSSEQEGAVVPRPLLLVVTSASDTTVRMAANTGTSMLVMGWRRGEPVRGHVVFPSRTLTLNADDNTAMREDAVHGKRPPYALFAVSRRLLAGVPCTQTVLAAAAGVSQPRVSQVLKQLAALGLVTRNHDAHEPGWQPTDWDDLTDWWLDAYPGPGGLTTYWYALDGIVDQALSVLASLREAGMPCAVSGDVAADQLAPWRRPGRALVYALPERSGGLDGSDRPDALDLGRLGFTPAADEEATLELVLPADVSVWRPAPSSVTTLPGRIPTVDPIQALWDLSRSPGSDTDQAVEALRGRLRDAAALERLRGGQSR